jgi:polar amino acid transport system substrate-binding protein
MTSNRRSFLQSATAAAAALAAPALAIAQDRTYVVGSTSTGIPFTFLDIKTNTIQGMMVDVATAIGQASGFKISVQQTVFSSLIPSLTSNKIDIISAAMFRTPVRAEVVDFSQPVYSYGEALIVKADDARTYTALEDLKGEAVGAQVGTAFIDLLNKKGGFKEVRGYDTGVEMMRDIALGRLKAGVVDQPIVSYQLAQGINPNVKIAKEYRPSNVGDVCLAVRKGDAELLARVNRGIDAIKADGTLARIVRKWNL